MINTAEETKRAKARSLRYRKAIVRNLNIESIREDLWEISEACDNVRYYFDDDETLLNALDGDEDETHEFKMMFADLCAEVEMMQSDLYNAYIPECFNDFFVASKCADAGGGLFGWDSYEGDYLGIEASDYAAERESAKRLLRLKKEELVEASKACCRIMFAYIGLRHRYDCLKSAMDILRDQNTDYLKVVKHIEEEYNKAEERWFMDSKMLDEYVNALPPEVWLQ